MYQYQLIPVSRLIEHLGDKGFLQTAEAEELQSVATRLSLDNFSENIIIQTLFNNTTPEILAEIKSFQETPEEHHHLSYVTLTKLELLQALEGKLNGERSDIEEAFATVDATVKLSVTQVMHYIPRHHPRAIEAVVAIYLALARRRTNGHS